MSSAWAKRGGQLRRPRGGSVPGRTGQLSRQDGWPSRSPQWRVRRRSRRPAAGYRGSHARRLTLAEDDRARGQLEKFLVRVDQAAGIECARGFNMSGRGDPSRGPVLPSERRSRPGQLVTNHSPDSPGRSRRPVCGAVVDTSAARSASNDSAETGDPVRRIRPARHARRLPRPSRCARPLPGHCPSGHAAPRYRLRLHNLGEADGLPIPGRHPGRNRCPARARLLAGRVHRDRNGGHSGYLWTLPDPLPPRPPRAAWSRWPRRWPTSRRSVADDDSRDGQTEPALRLTGQPGSEPARDAPRQSGHDNLVELATGAHLLKGRQRVWVAEFALHRHTQRSEAGQHRTEPLPCMRGRLLIGSRARIRCRPPPHARLRERPTGCHGVVLGSFGVWNNHEERAWPSGDPLTQNFLDLCRLQGLVRDNKISAHTTTHINVSRETVPWRRPA